MHKFVDRGTMEDRIDAMLESKRRPPGALPAGGGEVKLMDMTGEALLQPVALDPGAAMED